jgi:hypothetical protein
MSLNIKRIIIAALGFVFLLSLVYVQRMEVLRKKHEEGLDKTTIAIPGSSKDCVNCHGQSTPGIIEHWKGSTHARRGVGCTECHQANEGDVDAFNHHGQLIATIVTPRDCSRCHTLEAEEFQRSHHAKAGNILHSLDNFLAETVEGSREPFNPHSPTPGRPDVTKVNGMASAQSGCHQCHGSMVGIESTDGKVLTVKDFKPDDKGKPTMPEAVARIKKDAEGRPVLAAGSWPNTGIGRINLDGSRGSCSACHSRHDFSPRRARRPENAKGDLRGE